MGVAVLQSNPLQVGIAAQDLWRGMSARKRVTLAKT